MLATANGASYRYGGSDQAFYIPAVFKALEPAAFPRDTPLIDAQAHLILIDNLLASLARMTGAPIDVLFFAAYLVSLAVVWAGVVLIGSRLYASPWSIVALGAAFTMRHRISETSANSFEPYFHPRMVAFGLGLVAIGTLLRRRYWLAIAIVGISALVHTTTALWFAIAIGTALAVLDSRFRLVVAAGGAAAAAFLVWAATIGPLRQSWVRMDEVWLQAVASKDSLFADQWPAWAWPANLGLLAVIWGAHRVRSRRGLGRPEDASLVWGATALVAFFLITLPWVASRNAFVAEFQISRVFWLVDFLALAFAVGAIDGRRFAARELACLLLALSIGRGLYVKFIEHPERPLFAISIPSSSWEEAMHWLTTQPLDAHVLADPGHAYKFGTSVRVSAARDVFLEEVKDAALAIYSRDVAARVVERTDALGDFNHLTADHARELASRYDLDFLVTSATMPLPLAYENRDFHIYALK